MTVSNQTNKVTVNGNDVATSFSFSPMVINKATDITATFVSTTGVETALVQGTGATKYEVVVTTYPGTGSITYPTSGSTELATGEKIIIKRVLTLEQATEFSSTGGYDPQRVEDELDRAVMMALQQQEELDRCLQVSISSSTNPDTLVTTFIADAASAATNASSAATSATNAATSATAAQTAETNAETAETNAETAETNAETAETNAAASASAAATSATNAATSETNAATSATNAATAETNAETAETNAETAETNAEAALAAMGTALTGTSTTSLTIGTGSKTWTTQTGKSFAVGMYITGYETATPTNFMSGVVTSYTSGTGVLIVTVDEIGGSGTIASWTVVIAGRTGSATPPGGADTQVQYNNASAFGGSAKFTWNDTTQSLSLALATDSTSGKLRTPNATGLDQNAAGIEIISGNGSATGNAAGGLITISSGRGGTAGTGDGGQIIVQTGEGRGNGLGADLTITLGAGAGTGRNGQLILVNLPTADPVIAGALWNDTGILKISAG